MKSKLLFLGAILTMAAIGPPASAESPKYTFLFAKKGMTVSNSNTGPGTPSIPATPEAPNTGTGPTSPAAGSLETSQRDVDFGTAWVAGPAVSRYVTLTNRSTAPITFDFRIMGGSPDFTATSGCTSLAAGASCDIQVSFAPSTTSAQSETLQIATADGKSNVVQLSGTGKTPSVTLSTPVFGEVIYPLEKPVTAVVRLTNDSYQALSLTRPNLRNSIVPLGMFTFAGTTCGTSLEPGGSCDTTIQVGSQSSGSRNATFKINTGAGLKQVPLSATVFAGMAQLSVPEAHFGDQAVDTTSPAKLVQLTNSGNRPLTIDSMSFSTGAEQFGRSNTCGEPLAPGESCNINIAFTPTKAGYVYGYLSIVHNGTGATVLSVTGTGVSLPDLSSFNFADVKDSTISVNSVFWLRGAAEAGVTTQLSCTGAVSAYKAHENLFSVYGVEEGQGECTLSGTNSVGTSTKKFAFNVIAAPEVTRWVFPFSEFAVGKASYVEWETKNATSAELTCNNSTVVNGTGLTGKATVTPLASGVMNCWLTVKNPYGGDSGLATGAVIP